MKTYALLLKSIAFYAFVLLLSTSLTAQQWTVYDAGTLPTAATPAFSSSNASPAADFQIEVQDDPEIPGNKILLYDQPTVEGMQTYTMSWDIGSGTTATIVSRIKGLESTEAVRIMEIDMRNGNAGFRNKLQVRYDDTVQLERPSGLAKAELLNIKEWHIYRITMDGANYNIYVDEATEPYVSGETDRTGGDNWFKFGDQSGNYSHSGYIDWIIWDVTGAYAPGEGVAIPAELSTDHYQDASSLNKYMQDDNIRIYPSPAKSRFTVTIPEKMLYANILVLNTLGKVVFSSVLNSLSTDFELKDLKAGIYYINIQNTQQSITKELIIQ
jgi:hypothetical protein